MTDIHTHQWVGNYKSQAVCIDSPECGETPEMLIHALTSTVTMLLNENKLLNYEIDDLKFDLMNSDDSYRALNRDYRTVLEALKGK